MTTQTDNGTVNVLGWRLRAPSASGGKVYVIAVADRFTIVGWGRQDAATTGLQFKVERHANPEAAQAFAYTATDDKERKGYSLDVEPRASTAPVTRVARLDEYLGRKGGDPYLQDTLNVLLAQAPF